MEYERDIAYFASWGMQYLKSFAGNLPNKKNDVFSRRRNGRAV